jgi:hypothetical protein
MTPFHTFSEEICRAIQQAGRFEHLAIYYYHDIPVQGADESVLDSLRDQPFPTLDPVLSEIDPLMDGFLYCDPELLSPRSLNNILWERTTGASVILLSDAGAARGNYDVSRLLNTLAFLKALHTYTSHYVWLNPLPQESWKNKNNTATQIARYVPMFSLNREGIYRAINVLRGQPNRIERQL